MQKNENLNLDDLVINSGKEFDNKTQKLINSLAYEDAEIIPGGSAVIPTSDEVSMSKEDADYNLLQHIAMNKLKKENEEFKKMTDDEKVKDYICKAQYYRETNDFFRKYGYEMSGKQKRSIKRAIEIAWKKGKFKITPEQKEDILFELSKASQQTIPTQPNNKNNQSNISEHIKDLNSLIFRQ